MRFRLRTLMIVLGIGPPILAWGHLYSDALHLHSDALIVAAVLLGLWLDFRRCETKTRRPIEKPRARWWRYRNQE